MASIVLISCVSKKLNKTAPAKDIYVSDLFKKSLAYAYKCKPDYIYILSAKHGLLELNSVIEPYNLTLNTMSKNDKKLWAIKTINQLIKLHDLKQDEFTILAGKNYYEYLVKHKSCNLYFSTVCMNINETKTQ